MRSRKKFFVYPDGELFGCIIPGSDDQRCDRDCKSSQKCVCDTEKDADKERIVTVQRKIHNQ